MGEHQLTLGGDFSTPNLHQIPDYAIFTDNYFQESLDVGYAYRLWNPYEGVSFYYAAQIGFTHTGGDQGNRGSHRYVAKALPIGLKLVLSTEYFGVYTSGLFGVNGSINYLNFGRGTDLKEEVTANLQGQVEVGIQHCFQSLVCPGIAVGYFLERTIQGPIDYSNRGIFFGPRLAFSVLNEEIKRVGLPPTVSDIFPLKIQESSPVTILGSDLSPVLGGTKVIFNGGQEGIVMRAFPNVLVVAVPEGARSGPIRIETGEGSVTSRYQLVIVPPPVNYVEKCPPPENPKVILPPFIPNPEYPEPLQDCVSFLPNHSTVIKEDQDFRSPYLDEVVRILQYDSKLVVHLEATAIQGQEGSQTRASTLARARALAVRRYLVEWKRVPEDQVIVDDSSIGVLQDGNPEVCFEIVGGKDPTQK